MIQDMTKKVFKFQIVTTKKSVMVQNRRDCLIWKNKNNT